METDVAIGPPVRYDHLSLSSDALATLRFGSTVAPVRPGFCKERWPVLIRNRRRRARCQPVEDEDRRDEEYDDAQRRYTTMCVSVNRFTRHTSIHDDVIAAESRAVWVLTS